MNQAFAQIKLNDVVITRELARRKSRPINLEAEQIAFLEIANRMSDGARPVLDALCEIALSECGACSAGVSLLAAGKDGEGFSWDAVAGEVSQPVVRKQPRHHSPCGVALERDGAQLFRYPARYFEWMQMSSATIVEELVIPLYQQDAAYGTLWLASDREDCHFDAEDVRLMTELGAHATTALRLQGYFEQAAMTAGVLNLHTRTRP